VNSSGVVKVYSAFAPVYDATFGLVVGRYHRHIGEAALGVRRVLEIGVGTGLSLRHYPASAEVTAVDLCPAMLARAERQLARGVVARVRLQLADAERLPFADGSFEMVVLPFVVSVTPEPARLLEEARRLLAPGGQMVMLNHFAGVSGLRWLERLFAPFADRVGFRSDLTLERVLKLADLPVEEVRRLSPVGFFTLVRLRQPAVLPAAAAAVSPQP
jgi:phosphatidylethanolamine/phosphatidyl-N-methylethanolamine N-methyltransferase